MVSSLELCSAFAFALAFSTTAASDCRECTWRMDDAVDTLDSTVCAIVVASSSTSIVHRALVSSASCCTSHTHVHTPNVRHADAGVFSHNRHEHAPFSPHTH